MLLKYLIDWSVREKIFNDNHFGFMPFKDCERAINKIYTDIKYARQKKKKGFLISLDIQGAYDNVWWDGLIYKLKSLGLGGDVCNLIMKLISEQSVRIRWKGKLSYRFALNRGVLQGSCISPLLFSLYLADFFEIFDSQVCGVIYADDIFIYGFHDNVEWIGNKIQDNLSRGVAWLNYWNLQVNPAKCSVIGFGGKKIEEKCKFLIGGKELDYVNTVRILGYHLNKIGNNKHHINMLREKVFKKTNLLKYIAGINWGTETKFLVQIAKRCISSVIEGNTLVLSKANKGEKKKLQVLLNASIRWAVGQPKWCPIPIVLAESETWRLENRMEWLANKRYILDVSKQEYCKVCMEEDEAEYRFQNNRYLRHFKTNLNEMITFKWINEESRAWKIELNEWHFQEKYFPEDVIRIAFSDYLSMIERNGVIIATDASKSTGGTNIGIFNHSNNSKYAFNIPDVNSVFTAEAIAILVAIKLWVVGVGNFFVFSDSQSVLSALNNLDRNSCAVISRLGYELNCKAAEGAVCKLIWVPGHRGIDLNEQVDRLARFGPYCPQCIPWFAPEDWVSYLKKMYRDKERESWRQYRSLCNNRGWDYSKWGFPHHNLARDFGVLFGRFLNRTVLTKARLKKFFPWLNDSCNMCKAQIQDESHLILSCRKFVGIRGWTFARCGIPSGCSYGEVFTKAVGSRDKLVLFCRFLKILSGDLPSWPH